MFERQHTELDTAVKALHDQKRAQRELLVKHFQSVHQGNNNKDSPFMTLKKQEAESVKIARQQDERQRAVEELKLHQRKMKEQASRDELKKFMLASR